MILLPKPRQIIARQGHCPAAAPLRLEVDPSAIAPRAYRLSIAPTQITLIAHDAAAAYYGRQTLAQIALQSPGGLPCMEIEDWPDFPVRGVMLDISRDKVPTMQTLLALVDLLAGWKINQLQLYTEHTFAYRDHGEVWKNASPLTATEIVQLDEYCRARFVELVPNQNSFGHMERWLRLPRYQTMAEAADGAQTPWGYRWKGPFSLCPIDPRSIEFLSGLYDELLPNFTSKLFNVGCDETFDIGQGRSSAAAAAKGKTHVYLDFLKQVHALVQARGRTMMFWGDIIIDEPSLIGDLPRPIIALEWGYEADHPFDRDGRLFAESGVPFYVCPGTSSWLSIAGRTDNMLANQISAAENGLKHGAIGFLNTDWGDHGHLQYLPVSYAGLAAGAAVSWCLESNRDLDLPSVLDVHAFSEPLGKAACDLGNVYRAVGKQWTNSSALFRILVPSSTHKDPMDGITMEGLLAAEAAIDDAMKLMSGSSLVAEEFVNAAAMLRHACHRGMWKLGRGNSAELAEHLRPIIAEHRRLWLARNLPGGLEDSTGRLTEKLTEYAEKPRH
jgi:hexosaminidase